MTLKNDWYIYGPAALAAFLEIPYSGTVDVYFKTHRPKHSTILDLLPIEQEIQIRYDNVAPIEIVNLDRIYIHLDQLTGNGAFEDPDEILQHSEVYLLEASFDIFQSIRLFHLMKAFPRFSWPDYLSKKITEDVEYASTVPSPEVSVALQNLTYDFVG